VPRLACGVAAPFQAVAGQHDGAGDQAVFAALVVAADVDQQSATGLGTEGLGGRWAAWQCGPGLGEQLIDGLRGAAPGATAAPGDITIRGLAWSGAAPIAQVEVSIDDAPWRPATLIGEPRRHSWQWWERPARLASHGDITIRARATDLAGRTRPDQPRWNQLGYANNAIHKVHLAAVAATCNERRPDSSKIAS
jgi:hypothetical protein